MSFKIYYPNISAVQSRENLYYYSHCIENILKKRGYLGVWSSNAQNSNFALLCREVIWENEKFANQTCVIEGPCDISVYKQFGLDFQERVSKKICIKEDILKSKFDFFYSQIVVKEIPSKNRVKSDPFLFQSDNILYNKTTFFYHVFPKAMGWQPVLYSVNDNGEEEIIAIKKDKVIIFGMPVFDWLVFEHTFPRLGKASYYQMKKDAKTAKFEECFFNIITKHFLRCGASLLKISQWPDFYTSALTVRHDIDRPISNASLLDILSFYNLEKIKATWFYLKKTYNNSQIAKILEHGHEIALHSVKSGSKEFYDELKHFMELGFSIKGYSAHGGIGADGYLGETTFHYALKSGLLYGELLGKNNGFPCRAVLINNKNRPEISSLVLSQSHASLDLGMKPELHDTEQILAKVPLRLKRGEHVILMNHPDIHREELKNVLLKTRTLNIWYVTLEEVCQWTNFSKYLPITEVTDEKILINFPYPSPYDFTITVISSRSNKKVKVMKGAKSLAININNGKVRYFKTNLPSCFSTIEKVFKNSNFKPAQIESAIVVNTIQLEDRAKKIVDLLNLTDKSLVLELGCGYGFLSIALAEIIKAKILACDINNDWLEKGKEFLSIHENYKDHVSFEQFDYTKHDEKLNNRHHAIILNNTFCYIERRKQKIVVNSLYDYLMPNGKVYFYHFNPLHYKEPFNKLAFIHWVPKRIGEKVVKWYGSRTLRDLHYITPICLYFYLKRAGFKKISFFPNGTKKRGWLYFGKYFVPYYAMVAEK